MATGNPMRAGAPNICPMPPKESESVIKYGLSWQSGQVPVGAEIADQGLSYSFYESREGQLIGTEDLSHFATFTWLEQRAQFFWNLFLEKNQVKNQIAEKLKKRESKSAASEDKKIKHEEAEGEAEEAEEEQNRISFSEEDFVIEEKYLPDESMEVSAAVLLELGGKEATFDTYVRKEEIPNYEAAKMKVTSDCFIQDQDIEVCYEIFEGTQTMHFSCKQNGRIFSEGITQVYETDKGTWKYVCFK